MGSLCLRYSLRFFGMEFNINSENPLGRSTIWQILPFFFVWVSGMGTVTAQDYLGEIESLRLDLSSTVEPTAQATLLNDLSFAFRRVSPDSVMHYGQRALKLAAANDDICNLAYAYKNIGIAMYKKGDDHRSTLEHYKQALSLAKEMGDYPLQAGCLNNIGLVYHTIFQLETSLKYYFEGLELYETHIPQNDFRKGLLLANIGTTYWEMGDTEKAIQYFQKVMDYAQAYNHLSLYVIYCDNLASALRSKNQLEEALEKCKECLAITQKNNDLHSYLQANLAYANILFEMEEYEEAIVYVQEAYENAVKKNFLIISAKSLLVWARALKKLNKSDLAIQKATQAYNTSVKVEKYWQSGQIAHFLYQLYKEQGDHESALTYHVLYDEWSSKEKDVNIQYHVAELEAKYQNENHRKKIELLQKEQELNKDTNTLYKMGIGLLSLALLMGIYLFYNKKKAMKKLAELNLQLNATQESLKWKHDELQTIVNFAQEGITHKEFDTGACISCNTKALQNIWCIRPERYLTDYVQ